VSSVHPRGRYNDLELREADLNSAIGQSVVALDGTFLHVNPAVCSLTGYREQELLKLTYVDITHPDDTATNVCAGHAIVEGSLDSYVTDKRYLRKDGSTIWVRLHVAPIRDEAGDVCAFMSQLVDITAERSALDALAESERLFRLIAANTGDFLTTIERGIITWASPSSRQFGWAATELLGESGMEFVHPEDHNLMEAGQRALLERGGDIRLRIRIRTNGEGYRWTEARITPHRNEHGETTGVLAAVRDIAAQVEAEDALMERERDFRLLAENAADVVVRYAQDGTCLWVSGAVRDVLGWDPEEIVQIGMHALTHPDDWDDSEDVASESADEFRIRHHDGYWMWVARKSRELIDGSRIEALRCIDDEIESRNAADVAIANLAYRSSHDILTGLLNRDEIIRTLQTELRNESADARVAVLFIDLDHFKEINDGLSHAAGDDILRDVARRLGQVTGPDDYVGRFGGDEFAIVLTKVSSIVNATERTAQIRAGVAARPFWTHRQRVPVTTSIGVAIASDGQTANELLSDADAALYQAKNRGRNRWQLANEQTRAAAMARIGLNGRIRDGIDHNEFHAWYQPIVDLADSRVVGYEALARWTAKDGVIAAQEFIGATEESGVISELGGIIIAEAIAVIPSLGPDQFMTINASATQLNDHDFAPRLIRQLRNCGADPTHLVVEITEHSIVGLDTDAQAGIRMLAEAGVGMYVDDFGTGYSSLAMLLDFPVTGIKLDGTFARRVSADPNGAASQLVSGLAQIAERLTLRGIAEGIETREEHEALAELGWSAGQGWLFGKAQPTPAPQALPQMRTEATILNNSALNRSAISDSTEVW
jgi:diguanylate cyclase (GGDEF)-like protein/PAS domain S-box-containing protein